jgi:hypothetical protein
VPVAFFLPPPLFLPLYQIGFLFTKPTLLQFDKVDKFDTSDTLNYK